MHDGYILKRDRLGSTAWSGWPWRLRNWAVPSIVICLFLGWIAELQRTYEQAVEQTTLQIQELGFLPRGDYVKPLLLGYQQVAADIIWLQCLQVLGQRTLSAQEYEWLYNALDLTTTLDPQYAYAYQAGGVVLAELAGRVDLSNALLEKGLRANPKVWQIPFYLGYNALVHSLDYKRAADYMALAAQSPDRPSYLPGLATRLYAESGNIELAVDLLLALQRGTQDLQLKDAFDVRLRELIIEQDIRALEQSLAAYRVAVGASPENLDALVKKGYLSAIPDEPFGGEYRLEPSTGRITSSTHPQRLAIDPMRVGLVKPRGRKADHAS